ncbi:MAG TPA: hypothetical protein VKQ08_03885 [Cyclobacteriaceae bacterium]|nr:hypothetical protein [Cyclobacteriaceae bacterium]
MKWNYIIISVFVISLGTLLIEFNRLDNQYSLLIENGTTQLKLIQRLFFNTNRRHTLLNNIINADDPATRRALIEERRRTNEENTILYDSLLSVNAEFPEQMMVIRQTVEARKKYNRASEEYLQLVLGDSRKNGHEESERTMDNLFLAYQQSINNLFAHMNNVVLDTSDKFSLNVEKMTWGILLFSISPFILMAMIVVAFLAFVHYLSTFFESELK